MVGQRYFDSLPYLPFFEMVIGDAFAADKKSVEQHAPVQSRLDKLMRSG